ncbi:recombination-associated protein RdgC [Salinicola salarius]|uniref:recombination-associated protein RdgC n=1 Tax=Salinicola salarius TaxID=430457 RepID=UPI0023E41F87|nr:recombination-associated protein RdgC [Salinicola salarius]MDF3917480.1 recombination-associated protein RdgC [Salinicola salarius]
MFPKNQYLFRVHDQVVLDSIAFNEALDEFRFRPVSLREARRVGWAPPAGKRSEALSHEIQRHMLLTMLRQERLLPASVVNEEVAERADERKAAEGQPLSRRERQLLKEQVMDELLPQAFTQTKRFELWWDTANRIVGIHAGSRKAAEEALDLLRQSLGSLKVTPLATKTPPSRGMTQWLSDPGSRPASLLLGDQVELRAAEDDGVLRAKSVDLDSEEMQSLLENGRQAAKMGIGIEGLARFQLHDDLSIKGLQFDDKLLDEASQADDGDDPIVRFETDFALWSDAMSKVIASLLEWLGGEADPSAPTP